MVEASRMTAPLLSAPSARCVLLAFNASNQLAVRTTGTGLDHAFAGTDEARALARLETDFPTHTPPAEQFTCMIDDQACRVFFTQVHGAPADGEVSFRTLEELAAARTMLTPALASVLERLEPHLIEIPYLHLGESDYIYKFRVERDRNRDIYQQDDAARALYQSRLCEAIKTLARTNERSATGPARLDFGAVCYVIPSHFGFCLGVKKRH